MAHTLETSLNLYVFKQTDDEGGTVYSNRVEGTAVDGGDAVALRGTIADDLTTFQASVQGQLEAALPAGQTLNHDWVVYINRRDEGDTAEAEGTYQDTNLAAALQGPKTIRVTLTDDVSAFITSADTALTALLS